MPSVSHIACMRPVLASSETPHGGPGSTISWCRQFTLWTSSDSPQLLSPQWYTPQPPLLGFPLCSRQLIRAGSLQHFSDPAPPSSLHLAWGNPCTPVSQMVVENGPLCCPLSTVPWWAAVARPAGDFSLFTPKYRGIHVKLSLLLPQIKKKKFSHHKEILFESQPSLTQAVEGDISWLACTL